VCACAGTNNLVTDNQAVCVVFCVCACVRVLQSLQLCIPECPSNFFDESHTIKCVGACECGCVRVRVCVFVCVCLWVCEHVCMLICVCLCVCIYMFVCCMLICVCCDLYGCVKAAVMFLMSCLATRVCVCLCVCVCACACVSCYVCT
jgi:hypothetical protein